MLDLWTLNSNKNNGALINLKVARKDVFCGYYLMYYGASITIRCCIGSLINAHSHF